MGQAMQAWGGVGLGELRGWSDLIPADLRMRFLQFRHVLTLLLLWSDPLSHDSWTPNLHF